MKAGTVVWHDVECASYTVDLALWRELAASGGEPILDLGCGTGRVALELAAHGHRVTGLDSDPDLVSELATRARGHGLHVECATADARSFSLPERFGLAIAPMQVVQLLGGSEGRAKALSCVHRHLQPGALLAAALADPFEGMATEEALPPLPDVREAGGWVLSSRPVAVRSEPGVVAIDLLRQTVSPAGELTEAIATVRLDALSAEELEAEGREAGYEPVGRRRVEETADYVGSTVVLLEAR